VGENVTKDQRTLGALTEGSRLKSREHPQAVETPCEGGGRAGVRGVLRLRMTALRAIMLRSG